MSASVRIKIDEDLPADVAEVFRAGGHDAATVHEQQWTGVVDEHLWPRIQAERRWLVTADKGFANPRLYPPASGTGIILFRLDRESRAGYVQLAEALLAQVDLASVDRAVIVVTPAGIRIRRTR